MSHTHKVKIGTKTYTTSVETTAPVPPPPPTPSPYTLDEPFADLTRWGQHWSQFGNAPFDPALAKIVPGGLSLGAKRQPDGSFRGSLISSNAKYGFGYFEARIKVAKGMGMWDAFWLALPPSGPVQPPEIDIFELLANDIGTRNGLDASYPVFTVHPAGTAAQPVPVPREFNAGKRTADLSLAFHDFAVDRRADKLVWFLDGVEVWRYTGPGIPQVPLHIVLNLAVGGDWGGPADASTKDAAMLVAYVRVRS